VVLGIVFKARKIILLIAPTRAFDRGLLQGIARYANEYGPWTFYREPPHYQTIDWKEKVTDRLRSGKIDGIIMREPQRIDEILQCGIPGICAPVTRRIVEGFVNVVIDNDAVGTLGAEHLLQCGFRHFAYCGHEGIYWSVKRGEAFEARVARSGHSCRIYEPPKGKAVLWEKEEPLLVKWLKSLPKPVAVMCCNDDRALQVIEACKQAKYEVPDHVAVLGVDNDVLVCDLADPPISSISLNTEGAGYEAARLLDRLMKGEPMAGQKIDVSPTHIVTRMSTDVLAVSNADVSTALQFIRRNPNRLIQVSDVVEATNVSRRVLEKRFKAILRRSVHQEIRRVRVNHIVQLLIGTDMNITEIATHAGFDGVEHIARYFRKETGMSLRDYRKKHAPR
jgi:LacI family transcriptional regulator